ncbi:YfiR family protein [Janthinobacterium fluminis]|uniref:YfiR family protein n=1 Tax=Janthinobacterium fluminis TaxID=2987524 RepID=A0ABT5K4Y0_9BURK|nr:YfiR family protein [Janthinobacterium fluminis]MDC8759979.1 YfiR family protein [Janthinobacterium fluminis]
MRFKRTPGNCAGALLALLCLQWPAPALAQAVPEYDLKAAFVFNFAVFTDWPPDALPSGAAMTICVYQGNTLQPALTALSDKLVNGHKVGVRALGGAASLRGCQILVLDSQDRERWSQVRRELAGASVLTVSDDRADGMAIALSVENKRIGFDVDLAVLRQARLTLSSKLLRLARSVQ